MEKSIEWNRSNMAHPGKRYQGQFIDGVITLLLFIFCMFLSKKIGVESKVADVVIIAIPAAYFLLCDALPNGQSLSKRILNISVVSKSTGKPCTLIQSIVRNITTPILGAIDAILILGNDRQRFGDMFANTVVKKNG